MRKIMNLLVISTLFLAGCGSNSRQAQLNKLQREREALDQKIEKLKAEIAEENGALPVRNPPTVYVRIEQVRPTEFKHYITVQGTLESDNNILVPPRSPGLVEKIHVHAGDRVGQGQILAELDAAVLESSIAEVEQSLSLAVTIFERQQRLWNKNIGSEIEYLQAKNNKEGLEKRLVTLKEQLNLTKITAPIAGTVDEILIKEGEMAASGMGAFRIVQLSKLKITAELAENYISRIKRGDRVGVAIPVLNRNFEQRIYAVSQVIDPDNRTFQIELKVPASEKDLKPNLLAVLTINDYSNPEALVVPKNIVQETGDEQFLFVAVQEDSGWKVNKRIVHTGEEYGSKVEVLNGVDSGEYVVTFGHQNVADKQAVAVSEMDD